MEERQTTKNIDHYDVILHGVVWYEYNSETQCKKLLLLSLSCVLVEKARTHDRSFFGRWKVSLMATMVVLVLVLVVVTVFEKCLLRLC